LSYSIKHEGENLQIRGNINDEAIKPFTGKNVRDLAKATSNFLKRTYPLEGCISEIESDWEQGMIVKLTKKEGIKKYFPVEITRILRRGEQRIPKGTIYAYVSDVNSVESRVKTLKPFSASDFNDRPLNVDDNNIYQAKILWPEALPDKITIKPYDVNISDKGDFIVDFRVEVFKDNKKAEAGRTGLGLFVEPQKPSLFCSREKLSEEKTRIITRDKGQIYIPHGKSKAEFCISFKHVFKNNISVRPIHPEGKEIPKVIWFWVLWLFFAWAFLGGFVGGLIKFLGSLTLKNFPPTFLQRLVKAVIDIVSGIVVGGVLFLIVLLIPGLIEQLKTAVPVSGTAGQLVIGIIGGLIGAPGLSGLVLRRFFKK
jgi:hypothetical protein